MSKRLTLLCHGSTEATRLARFPLNEPLEEGQAALAGRWATHWKRIDRIWIAPELRTQQTAAAMLSPMDEDVWVVGTAVTQPALRDMDCGGWQGASLNEIYESNALDLAEWTSNPRAAPHGGESIEALVKRVSLWLTSYRENGHTIAVTHPSIIRAVLLNVLKAPLASFWSIDIDPLSATDLRGNNGRWTLRALESKSQLL